VETEVGYSPHHHADRHVGTHHDVDGGNASHGHRHHGSNRQTAGSDGDGLRGGGGEGAPASGGGFCEHRLEGGEAQGRVEGGGTEWKGGCDGDDGDLRGSFHQRRTDVPGASGSIHPDESHHSRNEYAVPAAAAETSHDRNGKSAPMVSTNDSNGRRATGILHGVSAAMASGALPAAARPKPNTTLTPNQDRPSAGGDQTERAYRGDESTSNHFPRVVGSDYGDGGGRRVDGEGLYQARATSARDDAGGGMERGGMSSARGGMDGDIGNDQDQGLMGHWRRDAMGEQARRHIDEALRERALRRRNRFVVFFQYEGTILSREPAYCTCADALKADLMQARLHLLLRHACKTATHLWFVTLVLRLFPPHVPYLRFSPVAMVRRWPCQQDNPPHEGQDLAVSAVSENRVVEILLCPTSSLNWHVLCPKEAMCRGIISRISSVVEYALSMAFAS